MNLVTKTAIVLGGITGTMLALKVTPATAGPERPVWCWVQEDEECHSNCDGGVWVEGGPHCWTLNHKNGHPPPDE